MDISTFGFWSELTLVPLVTIILLITAYRIARKNWECSSNRLTALALLLAAIATSGTFFRAVLNLDYFSKIAIIWRHIDLFLMIYFFFSLISAFWLLFQDPRHASLLGSKIQLLQSTSTQYLK